MLLHSCRQEVLARGEALGALLRAKEAGKIRFAGYSGDNEAATFATGLPGVDVLMCSASICDQANLEGALPAAARAGTLNPLAVVDAGRGIVLPSDARFRFETVVEQDWNRSNAVFGGDSEEPAEPFLQSLGVGFPHDVVDENPHAVKTKVFRPAQLPVYGGRIERLLLPHFNIVDRGAGQEVATDQPRLLAIPRVRRLRRPEVAGVHGG